MNIGIVVYSQTGNTHSVALNLQNKLIEKGYKVTIEKIEVESNERPRKNPFKLKTIPKIDKYDYIIFGSLVEAFSLSPVMREYLRQLPSCKNKKVSLFVTQYFPYPWMGGNQAIKKMKEICKQKGFKINNSAIVNWSSKKRGLMIENLIKIIGEIS